MRLRTLALYLIGNRRAILELAADRRALWVGLTFVFSAAFAREYDGEDLSREPWYLLVPVAASLVASFLLFLIACGPVFLRKDGRPPFFRAYRSFLALFWLTAPLAWLYAIPYERFLSPGAATSANLWTLAFVAAWRVVLMIRVVCVVTGCGVASALFLVMAFADAVALAAVAVMPKPVVSIMGGVRLTESEAAVQGATFIVGCFGVLSAPLWGIGGLIAFFVGGRSWLVENTPTELTPPARGVWILAAASILIWLLILPFTQAEQRLRSRVEREMRSGRIDEALGVLSAHERSDFPPGWEPPPRIGNPREADRILDVMEVLLVQDFGPQLRAEYVAKFRRYVGAVEPYSNRPLRGTNLTRTVQILQQLPEGPDIAAEHSRNIKSAFPDNGSAPPTDGHFGRSAEEHEALKALMKLGEKGTPRDH